MSKFDIGIIHGRFQPFHNGHLEYALQALDHCKQLVVGITSPELAKLTLENTDSHRHLPESNPFTYFERLEMVLGSLQEYVEPIIFNRIRVVPFDVSQPDIWKNYLPDKAVQIVTVHDEWDCTKANRFQIHGFNVIFLESNSNRVTATRVRQLIYEESDLWENLVPKGTKQVIKSLNISNRLK